MKERAVVLFLVAMGTIKVYENFSGEDEDDEFERDYMWQKGKSSAKKRSVEDALNRWRLRESEEALIEAVSGSAVERTRFECATGELSVDKDTSTVPCTCAQLICADKRQCQRNLTSLGERLMRCRQTILFGQNLCECKRFLLLSRAGRPLVDLSKEKVREELRWSAEEKERLKKEAEEMERESEGHIEPVRPVPPNL